uniref:Putative secreted protein n=1 Tax=Ixodes ricinus TaxID=34613 RepID=A0A6B0UZG7_IXORI
MSPLRRHLTTKLGCLAAAVVGTPAKSFKTLGRAGVGEVGGARSILGQQWRASTWPRLSFICRATPSSRLGATSSCSTRRVRRAEGLWLSTHRWLSSRWRPTLVLLCWEASRIAPCNWRVWAYTARRKSNLKAGRKRRFPRWSPDVALARARKEACSSTRLSELPEEDWHSSSTRTLR